MAKVSRSEVRGRTRPIERVTFEDQQLTRFGGLAVIAAFFARIGFNERLRQALRGVADAGCYGYDRLVGVLVVHQLLGFRELRELDHYRDDPLVRRVVGLERLPSVSTLSRLGQAPAAVVERLRGLLGRGVIARIRASRLRRVTLDFDGSVQSTRRQAEATAVGYNHKRKGERSYYPLLCSVAQLGEVFDVLHRPGNVHDSRGAAAFITACVERLRAGAGRCRLEARLDTAFCAAAILDTLERLGVAFTITMHFAHGGGIKEAVERRRRWYRLDRERDYFELPRHVRPSNWSPHYRLIVVRQRARSRQRGPLQLDLFEPRATHYTYKALVTNRTQRAATIVAFHEGRGEQEALIGELKSDCGLDYIPARRLVANQIYLLAGLLAHNLARELQIAAGPPPRANPVNRAGQWMFHELATLRRRLLWQPGRLIRPQGTLTLALADNVSLRAFFHRLRDPLDGLETAHV